MRGKLDQPPASGKVRSQVTISDHREQKRTRRVTDVGGSSHAAQVCRYRTETCHKCSKVGHIARMCKAKSRQGHTQYVAENSNPNDTSGNEDDDLF